MFAGATGLITAARTDADLASEPAPVIPRGCHFRDSFDAKEVCGRACKCVFSVVVLFNYMVKVRVG